MRFSKDQWKINAEAQANALAQHIAEVEADGVAIEEPTSMGEVGRTTNSVGKLLYHVGVARGLVEKYRNAPDPIDWAWYPVSKWKGSLPKKVVIQRVNRTLDIELTTERKPWVEDAAEAIAIGLHHLTRVFGDWDHSNLFGTGKGRRTSQD